MFKNAPTEAPQPLADAEYAALAAFRRSLRAFLAFSEEAARKAGLTPQQHQALLAIRGAQAKGDVTIGYLAGQLLLRPHTAVGLVDRLARSGLIRRAADPNDRRRVLLALTEKGEEALTALSATHLDEIRRNAPELAELLRRLAGRRREGA